MKFMVLFAFIMRVILDEKQAYRKQLNIEAFPLQVPKLTVFG